MTVMPAPAMTPETRDAGRKIIEFVRKYDELHLSLACHGAFPLVLTPDLLYQIWAEFVSEAPWVSVARLLLSPLCQEVSYEVFEMELNVRELLLEELRAREGQERLNQLAHFMLAYVEQRLIGQDEDSQNLRERQELTALAYIQPTEAARRLAQKLSAGVKKTDVREAFRWTTLAKTLATPLKEAGFAPLLTYNDILFHYAQRNIHQHQGLVQEFEREKKELAGRLGIGELKLPSDLKTADISWQPLTVEVANIAVSEPKVEADREKLQKLQFETVFVNKRGEISEPRQYEAYYDDEILDVGARRNLRPQFKIQNPKSKIRMIAIPEGEFWMGSPTGEEGGYGNGSPQHLVKVSPFFISQTPITQLQWRFVASLPQERSELKLNPASDGDDYPVSYVSWYDALEFCARLSRYTGRNYRLPSEAEWEYACRSVISYQLLKDATRPKKKRRNSLVSGELSVIREELTKSEWNKKYNQPFHFGATLTAELANYDSSYTYQQEPKGKIRGNPTPVGSFPPNAFGLYDMHGNVWEWCLDPWHSNYEGAPKDSRVWDEQNENENYYQNILENLAELLKDTRSRVIRGGSWFIAPRTCRSAYRHFNHPDLDYNLRGFRVVCVRPRTSDFGF